MKPGGPAVGPRPTNQRAFTHAASFALVGLFAFGAGRLIGTRNTDENMTAVQLAEALKAADDTEESCNVISQAAATADLAIKHLDRLRKKGGKLGEHAEAYFVKLGSRFEEGKDK